MNSTDLCATSNRTLCVAFNTGAYYSPHGQRIALWLRKSETGYLQVCCLVDFDRQICCYFPVRVTSALCTPMDLGIHAMHMYQWSQYDFDVEGLDGSVVRDEMNAVLTNGYNAFIQAPEVRVLGGMAERLRRLH